MEADLIRLNECRSLINCFQGIRRQSVDFVPLNIPSVARAVCVIVAELSNQPAAIRAIFHVTKSLTFPNDARYSWNIRRRSIEICSSHNLIDKVRIIQLELISFFRLRLCPSPSFSPLAHLCSSSWFFAVYLAASILSSSNLYFSIYCHGMRVRVCVQAAASN